MPTPVPSFEASTAPAPQAPADLLVLPLYQGRKPGPGVEEVARALGVDLTGELERQGFAGKVGETVTLPTFGRVRAGTLLLVGVGPEGQGGEDAVRRASMRAARTAVRFPVVASTLPAVGDRRREAAQAFAEGILLGAYRFDRYKREPVDEASRERPRLRRVVALTSGDAAAVREGLRRGRVYGEAANWARDLVNTPAIDATPEFLAAEARSMAARTGLRCRVWRKADLARGGFGGILGVGSGSANEPRLVELTYRGSGRGAPVGITGKGVTFDSGGLSIKDAAAMEWMKADMAGAAAVLAALRAVAELGPAVDVVAAVPCSENMPGGSAIRPGDVLRHRGGKTSEVLNTDAEGRLILADALAYLAEKRPRAIIDVATLTGAAMVALGEDLWAALGSDRDLVAAVLEAGRLEGEPGWELPLWTDYRRHIESTVADVKNVGSGRWGGAITAALFLKEFVGDVPWVHLDIAGTAFVTQPTETWPRGATGSPARTLIRYLETAAGPGGRRAGGGGRRGGDGSDRGGRGDRGNESARGGRGDGSGRGDR